MCWAGRCCFCVQLDFGGYLIGCISFAFSTFFLSSSVALLCLDSRQDSDAAQLSLYRDALDLNQSSYDIILVMLIVLSALGVISSCMLIYGLRKNKPGFVVWYFGQGIVLVIVTLLSALLELLKVKKYWPLVLGETLASMFYMHWLVVIHTIYELMQQGKRFGANGHERLQEEPFIESLEAPHDVAAI